jgi:WD40 repeat protein
VIHNLYGYHPTELLALSDRVLFKSGATLMAWDFAADSDARPLLKYINGPCEISRNGRWVATIDNNICKIWDLRTKRKTCHIAVSEYSQVAFINDDGKQVGIFRDRTIHVWDATIPKVLASFTGDATLTSCSFIRPSLVLVGDRAGCVHFLALEGVRDPYSNR